MPQPANPIVQGASLALSGGGFRSTLFQIGTLLRFNELGLLPQLKAISSVSGGSIASGFLGATWGALTFSNNVATNFSTVFVAPLRTFCGKSIDIPSVVAGLLDPFTHAGDELVKQLDSHLFSGKTLQDLPDSSQGTAPRFIINASSLQTGVRFWFSREDMGDWRVGFTTVPRIRLADAVAASSAFPPFFSPLSIDITGYAFQSCKQDDNPISDLLNDPDLHKTLECTDGGAYDNLALGGIWDTYDTLWVSDASSPLDPAPHVPRDWLRVMLRVVDVLMRSGEARRRLDLLQLYKQQQSGSPNGRKGTYWSTSTAIAHLGTPGALPCDPSKTKRLAGIGTRLAAFNQQDQDELINWGYALADASVRRHSQIPNPPPPSWPCPAHPL